MQFFGIGIPELLVILLLTVIVVGPERLPEVAAEMARWIRRARSYAQFVAKDFNEVVAELEREVGASREDWQEIASVVGLQTSLVTREIQQAAGEVREAADVEKAVNTSNVVPIDSARQTADPAGGEETAEALPIAEADGESADAAVEPDAEKADEAWYVPGRTRRRTDRQAL